MNSYKEVDQKGTVRWYSDESFTDLHREDGPAVEYANGDNVWYQNGKRHREDGPAVEYSSRFKGWYRYGQLHREHAPAEEWSNGDKAWFRNGQRHRDDGPAIELVSGYKYWYYEDEYIECSSQVEFVKIIKLKAFL